MEDLKHNKNDSKQQVIQSAGPNVGKLEPLQIAVAREYGTTSCKHTGKFFESLQVVLPWGQRLQA